VLSSATRYAKDVVRALSKARRIVNKNGWQSLSRRWSPPVFEIDLPLELRSFIEVSDHEGANCLVAELLRQIQRLASRLSSLRREANLYSVSILHNIAEYQLQAAKVKQICDALFPFARGETDELPKELDREPVVNTVRFMDDYAEDDPGFQEMANRFLKVKRPWWPARS
jgi:Holliday junction resolvase-like predicted endonuclease